jgi:lysophospholipase L1-like esterase
MKRRGGYMAEDKKKNGATVETSNVDGMKVRKYTLNEGAETLFKVKTEAEIEQDIQDYENRLREEAERKAAARHEKLKQQLKADLNDNNFEFDDISLAQAAEKLKIDPEQISEKMAELTKDDYIFCIGDSITYGFEVEGSQTWIGRLRRECEINLINVGVNGNTTADMIERFHEHVIDYRPKAVLIMGGGNDVMGGTQLEFVTNNLAMMAQMALDRGIIPIMGIAPEPDHKNVPQELKSLIDYDQMRENLATLKQWVITFAKANNLSLIDFDTGMKDRLRAGYGRYFFDGIHPNPSGHRMMSLIAKDAFTEMGILKKEQEPEDRRFEL